MMKSSYCFLFFGLIILASCRSKIKVNTDEVYSRQLQKHISITVISTPVPKNRSDFNLLILNDGQAMEKAGVKDIVNSLYKKGFVKPLIIVGIRSYNPEQEYGVSGYPGLQNNGALAEKYSNFIVNELLPFIKKKSGVKSFNSAAIAGSGMSGISALDIAWDNWQKFDKVAYLPNFFNEKSNVDFFMLVKKIAQSRKKPRLQFFLDQVDDIKNPKKNDSTCMERLFDVLKKKGVDNGVTRAGIESDKDRFIPFKDSFFGLLMWINQGY